MKIELFEEVIKFVKETLKNSNLSNEAKPLILKHLKRTLHFCEILGKCDEETKIAAITHDIGYAFLEFDEHEAIGAKIMKKFLAEKGAEPEFINVVEKIIKNKTTKLVETKGRI
jgi:predicted HD phosphohydrolase